MKITRVFEYTQINLQIQSVIGNSYNGHRITLSTICMFYISRPIDANTHMYMHNDTHCSIDCPGIVNRRKMVGDTETQ